MSTPINNILDSGQALAGVAKSYVDLSVKTDASDLDRQAAVYGYIGVAGTLAEKVLSELNKPGIAAFARNLGGGAALAGLGVSVQQYREAKAAWDADPSTANLNVVLEKAAGLSSNVGGVIAVLPGGQAIGGAIWIGSSLLENYYNGNFAVVGGAALNVVNEVGILLKPLQQPPLVFTGITTSAPGATTGSWVNNRTPAENVAIGLSPDGYPMGVWVNARLADGSGKIGVRLQLNPECQPWPIDQNQRPKRASRARQEQLLPIHLHF